MLSQDAKDISASLGALAGQIAESHWEFIKVVRANIDALAQQLEELENHPAPAYEEGAQ